MTVPKFERISMTVKKKQIVECDVIDVAFGGKGLTKIDGFAVFVDQTVTGDRVAARMARATRAVLYAKYAVASTSFGVSALMLSQSP